MTIAGGDILAMVTGGVLEEHDLISALEVSEVISVSPASILKEFVSDELDELLDSGETAWSIYIGAQPPTPSNCITIYDTQGILDGRLIDDGEVITHFGIQIRVRSKEYEDGWEKITDICSILNAGKNETITKDSVDYLLNGANQTTPVTPLGVEIESKRRFLFTVNYILTLKNLV